MTAVNSSIARCGAVATGAGRVQWRVWAPNAKTVDLVLIEPRAPRSIKMNPQEGGFFHCEVADISEGQQYAFKLDGGEERPDPCSLYQPQGVPGSSAVVLPETFNWTDETWHGVPQKDLVIYELHVGTFTNVGTFEAIIPRLESLKELGISAIELMPVGQFPGGRNWGYDGVLPYAAQNTYGGPKGLAQLVNAAHATGLGVILDVVYNHFGPEHNYLSDFGPYLIDCYKTPWGQAVNYDSSGCDGVRDYVLNNVRMWLKEFHLDGLRLDAVHAIYDLGARHILQEIKEVADEVEEETGRAIHIIAESDLNDPRMLRSGDLGGYGLDAQWADDFHHAAHAYLTGEERGYYQDFGEASQLARALETPFVFASTYSRHRNRKHGAPAGDLGAQRFVVCLQNHDQVGNRARGERFSELLGSPEKQRLAACLLMFSPYVPMLFMGEEYGELQPFPFFCSFGGAEMMEAVRQGRKREFADFVASVAEVPDPGAVETFQSAVLQWKWEEGTLHAGLRRLNQDLLTARREWPGLQDRVNRRAEILDQSAAGCLLKFTRGDDADKRAQAVAIYFNLSGEKRNLVGVAGEVLFSSEEARYMGRRKTAAEAKELLPWEVAAVRTG